MQSSVTRVLVHTMNLKNEAVVADDVSLLRTFEDRDAVRGATCDVQ